MKRTLASLFFALGLLAVPSAARADVTTLVGGCVASGGPDCEASCTSSGIGLQCDVQVSASCDAMLPSGCSGSVDASCAGGCEGSCSGGCTADPGNFSCSANCESNFQVECMANASAACTSSCMSDQDQSSCMAMCMGNISASCSGQGSTECEAQCMGTPPSASCDVQCQASCSGSCQASAKFSCADPGYFSCRASADASCEASFHAMCSASCTSTPFVLTCNGQVVSFENTLDDVKNYLEQHGYAQGEASASCSGDTCTAQASGSAGINCSAARGPGSPASQSFAVAGLVGIAFAASRLRRRKAA